uniref:VWFA domain-containing protein n=1 Tax=Arcella intermedia TaxID=1963864 RepID=A0A6B2KX13_9EUKA
MSVVVPLEVLLGSMKKRRKKVIIGFDKSGSMYRSWKEARTAIVDLISSLNDSPEIEDIITIFYDSKCFTKGSKFSSRKELEDEFSKIRVGGGTNFTYVFGWISSIVENSNSDIGVIFFSDGQDTSDQSPDKIHLSRAFQLLKNSLTRNQIASEVHSLGFTAEHDAVLLGKIATLGTTQGTFQYLPTTAEIKPAIENIVSLIQGEKAVSYLSIEKEGQLHKIPIFLDKDGKGFLLLKQSDIESGTISMVLNDLTFPLKAIPLAQNNSQEVELEIVYVREKTGQLKDILLGSPSKEVLTQISAKAKELDDLLDASLKKCFKLMRLERKKCVAEVMETKKVVFEFSNLLSAAISNTLTNEKIASFTNLAYKATITKNNIKKQLANRIGNNAALFDELDNKILGLVKKLNIEELKQRTSFEEKKKYSCILSTKNYVDAIEEGDCMCITLNVRRSQAAIVDPSQLKILSVNQTLMTADSFMESVKFAVERAENPESSHGGFDTNASASILKGLAGETITACLPLYISPEHWSIARLKMKPILGWITTLDVLGYSYPQQTTVPFLVLAKTITDARDGTEYHQNTYNLILELCSVIYKESTDLKTQLKELYLKYMESPENRTVDIIPNNFVFLTQLFIANRAGDIPLTHDKEEFFSCIMEEECRRVMSKGKFETTALNDLFLLFGLSKSHYIDNPVQLFDKEFTEFKKECSKLNNVSWRYSLAIQAKLATTPTEKKDSESHENKDSESQPAKTDSSIPSAPSVQIISWDGSFEVTDVLQQFVNYVDKATWKNTTFILQMQQLIFGNLLKFEPPKIVLYHPKYAQDPQKIYTMYIQNYLQRKNSERREASSRKTYVDPLKDEEHLFLKNLVNQHINAERSKLVTGIIQREESKSNSSSIGLFIDTTDLDVAAGILLLDVEKRGRAIFHQVILAVTRPNLPCAQEKVTMVLSGLYKGITLFSDVGRSLNWVPGKQNTYRIRTANPVTLDY